MAKRDDIPIETLRQLIRLDHETGRLFWLKRDISFFKKGKWQAGSCAGWNTRWAGKEAFLNVNDDGYRVGWLLSQRHGAHVIVFALHYGRWPADQVDHRDADKANNLPPNLREATSQQNGQNRAGRGGLSRFCGVSGASKYAKWRARCHDASGKCHHLGYFKDEVEAARAYDIAALAMHGDFAQLNFPDP